ncbi:MAG: exo-alpha-sialidase [bacterium]|nr:exo-alpha-sialidase [bacterium]
MTGFLIGIVAANAAAFSGAEAAGPFRTVAVPVGPNNPRNSEADILRRDDGTLLLAWTEFYEGSGADHGPARISGLLSKDNGETWTDKFTLVENDGGCNVMEVNFIELKNGDVALLYCQKNSESTDCRIMMRTSSDEGATWGEAKQLSPAGKYTGLTNGRCIRLKSGRILLESWEDGDAYCCISDDEGATWHDGGRIKPADGPCYEPSCIELKDGRVMMLMRTGLGSQFKSLSSDGGETWTEAVPTPLTGTAAPVSISRVPTTGDLLAIWNMNITSTGANNTNRTPLTAAISKDEGETWTLHRNIEEGTHDAWAYPAVTWLDNVAYTTYFTYTGGISLVFRRIPAAWFYGE